MRSSDLSFFLVGIACGAAVGLVFAPMTGGDLRRRIAEDADESIRLGRAAVDRGREARQLSKDALDVAQRTRDLRRPL
jgi:gas vesicle protein